MHTYTHTHADTQVIKRCSPRWMEVFQMTVVPCHQRCQTSLIRPASDGGERRKHYFTLSHLLRLPLAFILYVSVSGTFPPRLQTCSFCAPLYYYLSISHLCLSLFFLIFSVSTFVKSCDLFKPVLPPSLSYFVPSEMLLLK